MTTWSPATAESSDTVTMLIVQTATLPAVALSVTLAVTSAPALTVVSTLSPATSRLTNAPKTATLPRSAASRPSSTTSSSTRNPVAGA